MHTYTVFDACIHTVFLHAHVYTHIGYIAETAAKTRILGVVYNATSNELVRTNTIVKNTIVTIDATPFKKFYQARFGVELGKKVATDSMEEKKESGHVVAKKAARAAADKLDAAIAEQFMSGRLLACISSRPGQCGRADGYILEGKELDFYKKKLDKKKKN